MDRPGIVIDSNVIVSALRSSRGASYQLLMLIDSGRYEANISVPLVFEYEDAAKRILDEIALTYDEINDILDYICAMATHREIHYLWRPALTDPKDEMVLELAVAAAAAIVTYNTADFYGTARFGVQVLTPQEFLREIGELQ